jgi:NADPH-dependent 2,4-dienoyl-CoA reductase/sulfur reductase-like enzyme
VTSYEYLIVGGGMTADAAVKGIRELDRSGTIGLIGDDTDAPYKRPPLSKGLWKGKPEDEIWLHTDQNDVELMLGRRVTRLDLEGGEVEDDRGESIGFERLLLATGGRPRRLAFGGDHVLYYRTLSDFRRLWSLAQHHDRFVVIGGGFIGAEIAAALRMNGKRVTMAFPDPGIGGRVFPADVGRFLVDYYRDKGVDVRTEVSVTAVEAAGAEVRVRVGDSEVVADCVVAGVGLVPNTELAEAADLAVDDGIVVDDLLRTTHPVVFAAGDVASFYNTALAKRMRVEHEDNALTMGRLAGRNMAGANEPYTHQPYFYSDLFDLGYEAVGEVDARLSVMTDWEEQFAKGVLYYHREGRVRGVLMWNVWDRVDAARQLIASGHPPMAGAIENLV